MYSEDSWKALWRGKGFQELLFNVVEYLGHYVRPNHLKTFNFDYNRRYPVTPAETAEQKPPRTKLRADRDQAA